MTVAATPPTVAVVAAGTATGDDGAAAPSATGGVVAPAPVKLTLTVELTAAGTAFEFSEES